MTDYQAREAARAVAAKALQAAHPHLIAVGSAKGRTDSLNCAARNLRIELARAFPGVKFSVKTSRFSMGDDLRVKWTDGPNAQQVEEYASKYSGGNFDGMQDLYTYDSNAWTDAFGEAKYVSSSRDYSAKAVESVLRTLRAKYPGNMENIERAITVSADAYLSGKLRGVVLFPGSCNGDDLERQINIELSRRTWAVDRAPRMQEMADA